MFFLSKGYSYSNCLIIYREKLRNIQLVGHYSKTTQFLFYLSFFDKVNTNDSFLINPGEAFLHGHKLSLAIWGK